MPPVSRSDIILNSKFFHCVTPGMGRIESVTESVRTIVITFLIINLTRPAFNNVKPKDWYFVLD